MEQYPSRPESHDHSADQAAMFRLAWFICLALVLAMAGPHQLFAATFSALLGVAALAVSLGAMMLREPVWAAHLTRWDVAAMLYLLGAVFGWFVDRAQVAEFLQGQGIPG